MCLTTAYDALLSSLPFGALLVRRASWPGAYHLHCVVAMLNIITSNTVLWDNIVQVVLNSSEHCNKFTLSA